ncbi:MAG: hypothetical protein HYV93_09710 [Candidatus Rokubacteria bacterium]|nr:hypothetical protein [Candidatus Rokubacteria bacterium]
MTRSSAKSAIFVLEVTQESVTFVLPSRAMLLTLLPASSAFCPSRSVVLGLSVVLCASVYAGAPASITAASATLVAIRQRIVVLLPPFG